MIACKAAWIVSSLISFVRTTFAIPRCSARRQFLNWSPKKSHFRASRKKETVRYATAQREWVSVIKHALTKKWNADHRFAGFNNFHQTVKAAMRNYRTHFGVP